MTTQDAYVLIAADGSVTHTGHLDAAELGAAGRRAGRLIR